MSRNSNSGEFASIAAAASVMLPASFRAGTMIDTDGVPLLVECLVYSAPLARRCHNLGAERNGHGLEGDILGHCLAGLEKNARYGFRRVAEASEVERDGSRCHAIETEAPVESG